MKESGRARLLICVGEYVPGAGQSVVVKSELDALSDKYDTTLIAPFITNEVPAGVHVERISMLSLKGVLRLRRLVQSADVVHLHDSLGYMAVATATGSAKCLVTCHGIAPPAIRNGFWQKFKGYVTLFIYPWLYRRAVTVVTLSDFLGAWLRKRRVHSQVIVSNGAPEEVVVPSGPPPGKRLVYIGEVSTRKGLDLLIEGVAACPADVKLDVVGSGDIRWITELVARHGLESRVTIHGYLTDAAMMALLDTALAIVSFSHWEGFGLPIVEGFARGRPAIVLGGSAMAEIVTKASAGVVVTEPSALPAAVERVAEQWTSLSDAAIAGAKRLRWADTWASYDRLFEGIVDGIQPKGVASSSGKQNGITKSLQRPSRKQCSHQNPTILIDCDALRSFPGGIRRVTGQLEANLRRARPGWTIATTPRYLRSGQDNRSWHTEHRQGIRHKFNMLIKQAAAYTTWPQVMVSTKAILDHADVIICPNYVFPVVRVKRCIVIVHDTSPFAAKTTSRRQLQSLEAIYYWILRRYICFALVHAKGIIVPSEKVHRLILDSASRISAPIFVIPWGVSNNWTDPLPLFDDEINAAKTPYLLCVNAHNHESIAKITRAMAVYNSSATGTAQLVTLKVVGHYSDSTEIPTAAEYLGHVSDDDLYQLYRGALATVIASTNSGFGLPLIEALGSGCPCIVIKGTAEAEVAAGHGVYEVSDDTPTWARAMDDLVSNPIMRKQLARDGYTWAKQFTWDRTGMKLAEVIESLLQRG
ncbi:glycosyltransferase [Ferrimicrobium sp.]|jgi:glycosyltransferase involved in cell wall biosynthesis